MPVRRQDQSRSTIAGRTNGHRARHNVHPAAKVAESRKATAGYGVKAGPHGQSTPSAKAVRFLASLSDYERLRIVRYTSQNFDLDRMRTLLKKLGNPHEQFKTRPRRRNQGQGQHLRDGRRDAPGLRVQGRALHQPAPGRYPRAHPDQRRNDPPRRILRGWFGMVEPIVARMKPMPTYFDVLTADRRSSILPSRRSKSPSSRRAWAVGWTAPTSSSPK